MRTLRVHRLADAPVREGGLVEPGDLRRVIRTDCDVYDAADGRLLLRFRRRAMPPLGAAHLARLLGAMDRAVARQGPLRGPTREPGGRNYGRLRRQPTAIMGFMDGVPINYRRGAPGAALPDVRGRLTQFTRDQPGAWRDAVVPVVRTIDRLYRRLAPAEHARQLAAARETAYRISDTAFSTVSVNRNHRTVIHRDRGNAGMGIGNLTVFARGRYGGGLTCLPAYGLGVDVRPGDFLLMDVHEPHGNTAIRGPGVRYSLVCYLRRRLWERTRGSTPADVERDMATLRGLIDRP